MQISQVVVMLVVASLVNADTCPSSCSDYSTCTILVNTTANPNISSLVKDNLICNNATDATLGAFFKHVSDCDMRGAVISFTKFLGMSAEAIGAVEALMMDEEFLKPDCQWDELAAAMCLYSSLPADKDQCTNGTVDTAHLFCADECMLLMNRCVNMDKYTTFETQAEAICKDLTNPDAKATNCYAAQVSQKDVLSKPNCKSDDVKTTSLTGPFIVAGIALALAVVALVGLILITCRGNGNNLQPNSF